MNTCNRKLYLKLNFKVFKSLKENFKDACGFDPAWSAGPTFLENIDVTLSKVDSNFCNHTNSFVPNNNSDRFSIGSENSGVMDANYDEWFLETNIFCEVTGVGMSRDFYGDGFVKD